MTNIRLFAVIAASVVTTALVIGAISRPAHADSPRTMECFPGPGFTTLTSKAQIATQVDTQLVWTNQQLAAGKTSFGMMPIMGRTEVVFCAW